MARPVWIIVSCLGIIKLVLCTRHPGFVGKDLLKKFLNPDNFHQYKPHGHHILRDSEEEQREDELGDLQLASVENPYRRQRTSSSNVTTPQTAKPETLRRLRKHTSNLKFKINSRPTHNQLRIGQKETKKSVISPYFRLQDSFHNNGSNLSVPITTKQPSIPKGNLKENDTELNNIMDKKMCISRKSNKETKVTFNDIMAKEVDISEQLTEAPEICFTEKPVTTEAYTETLKQNIRSKDVKIQQSEKTENTTTVKPFENKTVEPKEVDDENIDDEILFSDIMSDVNKRAMVYPPIANTTEETKDSLDDPPIANTTEETKDSLDDPPIANTTEETKDSLDEALDTKEDSAEEPEDAQTESPDPPDYVLAL